MPDNRLQQFYDLFILNQDEQQPDNWELLSDWEKEDIIAGIANLESGKFKNIDEVLAKY
jgi:predicted transcriptional regulator